MGVFTILLDKNVILDNLGSLDKVFDLTLFDRIDSTNSSLLRDYSKRFVKPNKLPLYVAEAQTHGHGRRGRSWLSSTGNSLTFSFIWCFDKPVSLLSGVSLVISLAIVRVLRSLGIKGLSLKWPNDILFDFSKLAGVLVEVCNSLSNSSILVIGIGINVNPSPEVTRSVNRKIVDLFSISNCLFDRNILLISLLHELVYVLREFGQTNFSKFNTEWNDLHAYGGKNIVLSLPDGSSQIGTVETVDNDGSLLLILPSGMRAKFNSGELI